MTKLLIDSCNEITLLQLHNYIILAVNERIAKGTSSYPIKASEFFFGLITIAY